MQLSRQWWKPLLSWTAAICLWTAAVCLCVFSGEILRFVNPVSRQDAAALEQHVRLAEIQLASIDPAADAIPQGALETPADSTLLTAPPAWVASQGKSPTSAEVPGSGEVPHDMLRATPRQENSVNLRITRDSARCPNIVCYKWHLVTQRLKPPHYTKVELAGLRLPPGLRHGVESGHVDLFIDAMPQHKTIHGHDTLIFVATNLAGVTPHDARP